MTFAEQPPTEPAPEPVPPEVEPPPAPPEVPEPPGEPPPAMDTDLERLLIAVHEPAHL